MNDKDILKKIYLFENFSTEDLEKVQALAKPKDFIAGDYIFSEGRPGTSLFVVLSGQVEILKKGDEEEAKVAVLGIGSHFGEMAFFDSVPRTASAIAKENTKLLEIPFDSLTKCLDGQVALAVKFYKAAARSLCRRIHQTTADFSSLKELRLRHV